jgi:energy-coupling factor transport system ATP-binding protein
VISLKDLTFAYPDNNKILNNINLSIAKGERIVICGRNGCGKSTLLRLIVGLLEPSSGAIAFESDSLPTIGFVGQKPENQMISGTVSDEIAFALEYQQKNPEEIRDRVDKALETFDISDLKDREPSHLSGGQMQRVAFATAWALNPEIWILDEVTSYLDPIGRKLIHDLILNIDENSIVIIVASDPSEYSLADRLIVIDEGKIVADDKPGLIFRSGLLNEIGLSEPRTWILENCKDLPEEFFQNYISGNNQEETMLLPELPSPKGSSVDFAAVDHISIKSLHGERKEFLGASRKVIHDVNVDIKSGEIVALIGLGGAGKSSLIELMSGLIKPSSGSVSWDRSSPAKLHGRIGVAFQFPEKSFFAETVLEEVSYGPHNLGYSKSESEEIATSSLLALDIDPDKFSERSPFDLSGGEARRVALAAVWALRPKGYLLDEPTSGLDNTNAELVGKMIRSEAKRGCPVVIAGHDMNRFADWCDRWIMIEDGKIVSDGNPQDLWEKSHIGWSLPDTVKVWKNSGQDIADLNKFDLFTVLSKLIKK